MAAVGAVELKIGDGTDARTVRVDDAWLRKERKRIEDLYTFQIDNFGRVILREDRKDFDTAVKSFLKVVEQYHEKVRAALDDHRASFRASFVAEFLSRWKEAPPEYMTRWGNRPDEAGLRAELAIRADEVFENMLSFQPPSVRLVEKNVSPTNVEDPRFLTGCGPSWNGGAFLRASSTLCSRRERPPPNKESCSNVEEQNEVGFLVLASCGPEIEVLSATFNKSVLYQCLD